MIVNKDVKKSATCYYPLRQGWLGWTQSDRIHRIFSKKHTILPIFGFFQFSKIFIRKIDKNKINAYAV